MGFGALAPLPLRLGGTPEDGLTASQFLRLTADLAAARRTLPFAVMRIEQRDDDPRIVWYAGRNGVGQTDRPTISWDGTHTVVTFKTVYIDGAKAAGRLSLKCGKGGLHGATGHVLVEPITVGTIVRARPQTRAGALITTAVFTLMVYA